MSWALTEDWLNVAGLSLLTIGTGAQAAGALAGYRAILKTLPIEVRNALLGGYAAISASYALVDIIMTALAWGAAPRRTVKDRLSQVWFVIWTSPIALVTAITAVPRKIIRLKKEGGEVGRQAARLARASALWTVLMLGSALALCAAVIQLMRD